MGDDKEKSEPNKHHQASRSLSMTTTVLISVFVTAVMALIFFGPETLPEYRHRAFAMICALLAGLLTWFLVGDLTVESNAEKTTFGKVKVKASGGIGVFIVVLFWWSTPMAPIVQGSNDTDNIVRTKPDYTGYTAKKVALEYKIPEAAAKKYLTLLRDKYVPVEELNTALREKAEEYKSIKRALVDLKSEDDKVKDLLKLATEALDKAQDAKAKSYLKQAIDIDVNLANISSSKAESLKRSAAAKQEVLANISLDRFEFKEAAKAYRRAIILAKEGKAPIEVARYQKILALVNLEQSESTNSLALLKSSLEICEKNKCGTKLVVEILHSIGKVWQENDEPGKAIEGFRQALAYKNYEDAGHTLVVADIWWDMGRSYLSQNNTDDALKYIQKSIDAHLEKDENHPHLSALWTTKADVLDGLDKPNKAKKLYEQALTTELKLVPGRNPRAATIRIKLGELLFKNGKFEKAQIEYQKAHAMRVKIFGEKHIQVADVALAIGRTWSEMKQYQKALDNYQQSIESYRAVIKKDSIVFGDIESFKGIAYAGLKQYDKAVEAFKLSLRIFRDYTKKHAMSANYSELLLLSRLGYVEAARKRYKQVIIWHTQAIMGYRKRLLPNDFKLAELRLSLGLANSHEKKYSDAINYLNSALIAYKAKYGESNKNVEKIYNTLGLSWSAKGDQTQALNFLQQSLTLREKLLGKDHPSTIATKNKIKTIQASL